MLTKEMILKKRVSRFLNRRILAGAIGLIAVLAFQNCSPVRFDQAETTEPEVGVSPSLTDSDQVSSPGIVEIDSTAPVGSVENPAVIPLSSACVRNQPNSKFGPNPGQFSGRIDTTRVVFRVGERIPVRWQGFPSMSGNWITIVPHSYEDESWCAWFWNRSGLNNTASSESAGSAFFIASEPGYYEVRGYYHWNVPNFEVIARTRITVIP